MLYIDSCSLADIDAAFEMGVVSGVTTNPILANKAGSKYDPRLIGDILEASVGPVHVQLGETDSVTAVMNGANLYGDRVVYKIPCTLTGLALVRQLEAEGIRTNVTAVMNTAQAILAAAAGASYVSFFWGRMIDSAGEDAYVGGRISNAACYFRRNKIDCQIIAGSMRETGHVTDAFSSGAHIVTASLKILREMVSDPMTDKTIGDFNNAWLENLAK